MPLGVCDTMIDKHKHYRLFQRFLNLTPCPKINQLIQWFVFFGMLPHEIWHYLAARALGLDANLGISITYVQRNAPRWKHIIVLLAPACVFLFPLIYCISQLFRLDVDREFWMVWTVVAISSEVDCFFDFQDVWYLITGREEWRKYDSLL